MHESHQLARLGAPERILVRYGELALKGGNRGQFEKTLALNITDALARVTPVTIERLQGRFEVVPERRVEESAERLADVFGIKSLSPAWCCASELEPISALALRLLDETLLDFEPGRAVRMRVTATRSDKRFPLGSVELEAELGSRALAQHPRLVVDLQTPELTLGIDVRYERSYVFTRRLRGPGGLPVGTLGRGLVLLSGGIDSPVAAWLAMKRGLATGFISFHSPPYLGEPTRRKVIDLARALSRYQRKTRMAIVPFTEVQLAVVDCAPQIYRTVIYRRFMHRIASELAQQYGFSALVTGESMGQVASQTIENLRCIEAAATLPVLRPLLTFDKDETIALARRIGTLAISNEPAPDCCTLFLPNRAVIRGDPEVCARIESEMDVPGLVEQACSTVELLEIEAGR